MTGYVYQFKDVEGDVVYVGHTQHMYERMCLHFGNHSEYKGVIPKEERGYVQKVEYVELNSQFNMLVLEAYLIALWKPKYNRDFVREDELTFKLEYGELEWKEWELRLNDNPHHHVFVWKDNELLYEIPKVEDVYTPLCEEIGIKVGMNFGYGHPVYDNGYKLMRLSEKRRITTGNLAQHPKYSFMGYPERFKEAM